MTKNYSPFKFYIFTLLLIINFSFSIAQKPFWKYDILLKSENIITIPNLDVFVHTLDPTQLISNRYNRFIQFYNIHETGVKVTMGDNGILVPKIDDCLILVTKIVS